MATVEVTFTPLPAHVRTARLVATAVARRAGVADSLLDEVRLAVGEACTRAVAAHRRHRLSAPVRVDLADTGNRFEVVVTDAAPAEAGAAVTGLPAVSGSAGDGAVVNGQRAVAGSGGSLPGGVVDVDGDGFSAALGLAVISGLADEVQVSTTDDGLSIRMSWPVAAAG